MNDSARCPLSIIICTRNRASALRACLEAIPVARIRDTGSELLLINNGSTDDTRAVLDEFAELQDADIQVIDEPEPGLSNARNAGLAHARGDVIAFTDDDCYMDTTFVDAIIDSFNFHTDIDYAGGRILLHDPTDALYTVTLQDTYEVLPPGKPLRVGKIKGACMIFRRATVEDVGQFDRTMGAGSQFRCEDADYLARATMLGHTGAHIPEIVVSHHHGRKPGDDINAVKRDNDLGRGSHYAKLILMGARPYIGHWIRETIRIKRPAKLWRELRGAIAYWRYWKSLKKHSRPRLRDIHAD